ncbi:hypothetical protein TREMEDRAFT_63854 [Tremella mesenterica DSM 1558]|uniref:uncharacterized protein n=1 Tax=Tremella mesenterica (strain ATCC 24925 / CBS 8224 / DSM 1558 / NBRC 9311 / NRRL Y-6157 / RJB 2259-6 / UBC 559-6) TaxID=578456 RepID=UPI0003F4962D|nr:uncharacterized protein TREMEDRAFT_63854 [Tremella mesenterica DSM 1558]EIW67970.1 hypothetical protein TREMEDRAFT_63854 [Tremella mesenterica DSM 1558]
MSLPGVTLAPPMQSRQGQLGRMRSATDIAGVKGINSPLTALRIQPDLLPYESTSRSTGTNNTYSSSNNSTSQSGSHVPPVPSLDFDMFRRSASRYSIDSMSSLSTISQLDMDDDDNDDDDDDKTEGATTPRATRFHQAGYFEGPSDKTALTSQAGPSDVNRQLTPKRSFVITSRPAPPPPSRPLQPSTSNNTLRPVPGRNRANSRPETKDVPTGLPQTGVVMMDTSSVHGEQGDEWGEDEANFEWLDADAPEAINGTGDEKVSPSKKLLRLKSAMGRPTEGRRLKKPLVFARRAPPPPLELGSEAQSLPSRGRSRSVSKPTSPVQNPNLTGQTYISHPTVLQPRKSNLQPSQISQKITGDLRPPLTLRHTSDGSPNRSGSNPRSPTLSPQRPTMVALKDEDDSKPSAKLHGGQSRNSQMSFQSVAYSFYDLGPDTSVSPKIPALIPSPRDIFFPNGRYHKVSLSKLEREKEMRERTMSEPVKRGNTGKTPDDFVDEGLAARERGDAAKAAWFFMKAAEGGSTRGRIHWGLCLKHGSGVALNDKRAMAELLQASSEGVISTDTEFQLLPSIRQLNPKPRSLLVRDLATCMSEIGSAYLHGQGVKKSSETGMKYLRCAANLGDIGAQEQLGFLLSRGSGGVKKDMKEAAKWYRMAVDQGSGSVGLAWIYKMVYMG